MKKPFAQYLGSVGFAPLYAAMISDTIEERVRGAVQTVLDGLAFGEHETDDVVEQIMKELRK